MVVEAGALTSQGVRRSKQQLGPDSGWLSTAARRLARVPKGERGGKAPQKCEAKITKQPTPIYETKR